MQMSSAISSFVSGSNLVFGLPSTLFDGRDLVLHVVPDRIGIHVGEVLAVVASALDTAPLKAKASSFHGVVALVAKWAVLVVVRVLSLAKGAVVVQGQSSDLRPDS